MTSPESKITAVNKASKLIKNRGTLDCNFPDLYKASQDRTVYELVKKDIVQPIHVKTTFILPTEGLESIRNIDRNTSPSGIEPSINRAYYANKKCLYLWDYEKRTMIIHEEEDDIVGVAFVKPKPDIFTDEINYLLIISTTREVKIIALSYNPILGLKVFQTGMSTTTNGVNMTAIIGTKFGRIFMLSIDGNVWELDYRGHETWFEGKCSKKLHTVGGRSLLSFFGPPKDPVIQIVVNASGTVLYQLTANAIISVSYLGVDGQAFNTVCDYKEALAHGRRHAGRSLYLDPHTFKIVSINPTLPTESTTYHLVAITSTGLRLYFSHYENGGHLSPSGTPNGLVLVHVRDPANDTEPSDVFNKALYKNAIFIGVKNQHQRPADDKIVTYSLDLARLVHPAAIRSGRFKLGEFSNEINVPGKVITIVEAETSASSQINELTAPYESPARIFLALTTYGLAVLAKQRPIDMLHRLLTITNIDTDARILDFHSFFSHFGHINGVSLCLGLLCADSRKISGGLCAVEPITEIIVRGAITLLDSLGNEPSAFNDGSSYYSSRHDGLALFIYRTINPIWNKNIINTTTKNGSAVYTRNLSSEELQYTQKVLRILYSLMVSHPSLFQVSPNKAEEESYNNLRYFIEYTSEAISFIEYFLSTDLNTIMKSLNPKSHEEVKAFKLEGLTQPSGHILAKDLAYALVEYSFSKTDNIDLVIDVLTQHCSSFCGANDVLLYKASKQIFSARSASNITQAKAILTESLYTLQKIALHIPADKAAEIAQELAYQGYHVYGIQLALACIKARDPLSTTDGYIEGECPPNDPKAQVFESKKSFYDIVFDLIYDPIAKDLTTSDPAFKKEIFKTAFAYCDKSFAYYVYNKFLVKGIGKELITESPPYIEEFLTHPPISKEKLRLLAEYYKTHEKYEEAATAFYELAILTPNAIERIDYLGQASVCINCVTRIENQYEMYHLKENIKQILNQTRQQNIPVQ